MLRWLGTVTLLVSAAGCATTTAAEGPPAGGDVSAALSEWARAEGAEPASVTLWRETPAQAPRQTVRIRRPEPRWARRGRPVDVRFERAPLASALRLLADAADLGIVIGEGLDAPVTVDLRGVRPVEAMRALAAAHDVELSMTGRTVVARRRD